MRSAKLPMVTLSLVALSACESSKPPQPEPRTIEAPTASAKPRVPTRKIHPLSPDMPNCLEMYTACKPSDQGPLCTSAPFHLNCGEIGTVPGGDTLECVCP